MNVSAHHNSNSNQNVAKITNILDGHPSSSSSIATVITNESNSSAVTADSSFESLLTSAQVVKMDILRKREANILKSPSNSKPLVTRMRKRYRLIKKSPLKGSPIKNLNHMFRSRRRKTKAKGLSPRKLQFILPKITKFSPKKVKYPRLGPAKLSPIVPRIESSNTCVASNTLQQQPLTVSGASFSQVKQSTEPQCSQQQNAIILPEKDSVHSTEQSLSNKEESTRILEDIIEEDEEDDVEDVGLQQQEEHLAAFLKASSTIASQRAYESREQRQQRRLQERIDSLAFVPDLKSQENVLVLNYLLQVKEALVETKFEQFVALLNGIRVNSDPVEEVYQKIMEILKGFPDLQEFFVAFLRPDQAMKVGKYAEFCVIERMRDFVDEFKYHFSKQPQNMQKVRRMLYTLLGQDYTNVEDIISALKPLLKLQPWLIESLLQCMPGAKPKQSLPEDFEDINLDCPNSPGDDFEHINMVDEETKATSTDSCPCDCHHSVFSSNSTDVSGASPPQTYKPEHCISCGLRFIDGRVYVRFGKALRLAKVTYLSETQDSKAGTEGPSPALNPKSKDDRVKITSNKQAKICHSKLTVDTDAEKPKKGRKTKKS